MSSADRCRILREGYLDVKSPPDSPERILHKAWRRLWVVTACYTPPGRSSDPQLVLEFHRRPRPPGGGTPPPAKRVRCPREGLRLFRCRSSSRPMRTFGMASGSELIVYLAAETEARSQDWMDELRQGIWPGFSPPATGDWWDVSLLDDEASAGCGLLGAYGRLGLSPEDALCLLHPHWQATQMRWGVADLLSVNLVRNTEDGEGVFKLIVKSNKKDGRIFQFYSKRVSETIEWIQSIIDPNFKPPVTPKSSKLDTKQDSSDHSNEYSVIKTKLEGAKGTEGVYEIINQGDDGLDDPKHEENKKINEGTDSASKNETPEPQKGTLSAPPHKTHRRLPSLPGHLLDASMCSLLRGGSSGPASAEVSDSDEETFDHIYEEMRDERSGTVYEEVDDDQGAAKAPDPATLRLQKLSESLSEALQIATQVKEDPKLVRRKSSKKAERPMRVLQEKLELPSSPLNEGKRSPLVNGVQNINVHGRAKTAALIDPTTSEASQYSEVLNEAEYMDMR